MQTSFVVADRGAPDQPLAWLAKLAAIPLERREALVIRWRARRKRPRPAEPLKPRRDLKEIQVRIIATAGTDEVIRDGVAAFYEMDRSAPQEGRLAVVRLTGEQVCRVAVRL
jgi:hypothetical protein